MHAQEDLKPAAKQNVYRDIPIPGWFQAESICAFQQLSLRPSDVVFASVPKAGTHLVKQTLLCLLRLGLDGEPPENVDDWDMKHNGFIEGYPSRNKSERKTFAEINTDQADPRLMVTHTTPAFGWPDLSSSKLVYVLRNPKDTCTSLYYMFGVPSDGWEGGFARYTANDCTNAFGSYFDHVRIMDGYVKKVLGGFGSDHAHLVYFEDLVANPCEQLKALASFLQVPLNNKKLEACLQRISFDDMKRRAFGAGREDANFFRKGVVGDWRRHFTPEQNIEFERIAIERLRDVEIFAPYLEGGRLHECMSGSGTEWPCWLNADHEEQQAKRARL